MSVSCQPENGLLLLLQAAQKLDEQDISHRTPDRWEHRTPQKNSCDGKYTCMANGYNYGLQKRPLTSIRCTHNELEKSRRAHLRTCMENLKEHLNFDNDVPRITMLTVLKKATETIQNLRHKNQCLENCEDNEKQRFAQLIKRRQALRKRLEEKRSRSIKLQSWRERNRNCSECSINTTSSDDSELELQLRSGIRSGLTASFGPSSPSRHSFSTEVAGDTGGPTYLLNTFKTVKHLSSPVATTSRSPVGLDTFDASSSDSGFEEITIASSGAASPEEAPIVYCIRDGSPNYLSKACRAL